MLVDEVNVAELETGALAVADALAEAVIEGDGLGLGVIVLKFIEGTAVAVGEVRST